MTRDAMKVRCATYLNKKKGYTADIYDYVEDDNRITFELHILRNGAFRSMQHIILSKDSELGIEGQLESQVTRIGSLVENGLI